MAAYFVSEGMQMKTMKKKRKEVEELDQVNDDFSDFSLSSPARKIRRLDAHLPPIMEEEEAEFSAAQNHLKSDGPIIEELPSENQEKAIVLFKPVNTPVFSIHSDLISGFKDLFLRSSHYGLRPSGEENYDETLQNNSNQCKAVVPWVPSQLPQAPPMEVSQSEVPEEMMEAEEMGTETMEIEESTAGPGMAADGYGDGMWTGNEGFPQWQQQHCMMPQPPHNTPTPITWLQ